MRNSKVKKQYFYIAYLLIAWLIAASCANIVTPTGGARDLTAPVVTESTPVINSKNFQGNTIKITFDEFVKLTNASSQVIISPFTLEQPEIKVRGHSVVVDFKDTLKGNTTYSVAFGNSISDITENNILSDYRFVFSTGPLIDTLMIKGVLKDAFTQKAESDIYVMLYDTYSDSVPLKEVPLYVARTAEDGSFHFTNIPYNKYKVFALKDVNSDFLFDQPNEKIAFLDTLIIPEVVDTLKDSVYRKKTIINLNLFEQAPATQRLMKAYPSMYGRISLIFRKPLGTFNLREVNKMGSGYKAEINKTKDTLTLWMNNPDDDSLYLEITDNNVIVDTAEVELIKKGVKTNVRSGGIILALNMKHNATSKSSYDYMKPVNIEFSNPIVEYDLNKVFLIEESDTLTPPVTFDYTGISENDTILRKFIVDYKWKEGTKYSLILLPAAFRDIFSLPNDTLRIDFKTAELKDYGNIALKIDPGKTTDNLIVQIVNENEVVTEEKIFVRQGTIKFEYLRPGNYRIKVIKDDNKNGIWDTGNYLKNQQPEKVFYNPSTITVKANWDMELDWSLDN